ncbi:MAG: hypothetical protein Q9187_004068, partial [Circinaria calcarea]
SMSAMCYGLKGRYENSFQVSIKLEPIVTGDTGTVRKNENKGKDWYRRKDQAEKRERERRRQSSYTSYSIDAGIM